MPELLQHKAVIMVEGNDVATGLKWALLSNSVVLMTPPSKMTYAMEDLAEDFFDVEEKMQWVLDHDHHAKQIAIRATLWIQDLIEHPEAETENMQVEEEILRRYQKHFRLREDLDLSNQTV
jgi:hypothetical protein